MARSKEYQKGEKAGREAGRKECLDFLRNKDAELSEELERWLKDQNEGESVIKDQEEEKRQDLGEQEEMGNQESNGHQSIASRLPPEVLSMAFSHLDSHRLIMMKRVSPQRYETIDSNAFLFKVLNLPLNSFGMWDNSILEYFTRKSQNQLEQVILPVQPMILEKFIPRFVNLLSLSASHLHTLSCALDFTTYASAAPLFSDTLRNLQSLSISFPESAGFNPDYQVRLSASSSSSSASSLKQGSSQHLRHLLINGIIFEPYGNDLTDMKTVKTRLSDVKYLSIYAFSEPRALGNEAFPLSSIKILDVALKGYGNRNGLSGFMSHLPCPNLKLLILNCTGVLWLGEIWPSSMEEFWLAVPEGIQLDYNINHLIVLAFCCPRLRNLRVDSGAFPFKTHLLAELLEKRFDNAEAGLEVDGQPMVFLEKLIIPKKHFGKKMVARLEKVAGKVVDSKDVPDRIEIDLSESTSNEAQRDYL